MSELVRLRKQKTSDCIIVWLKRTLFSWKQRDPLFQLICHIITFVCGKIFDQLDMKYWYSRLTTNDKHKLVIQVAYQMTISWYAIIIHYKKNYGLLRQKNYARQYNQHTKITINYTLLNKNNVNIVDIIQS